MNAVPVAEIGKFASLLLLMAGGVVTDSGGPAVFLRVFAVLVGAVARDVGHGGRDGQRAVEQPFDVERERDRLARADRRFGVDHVRCRARAVGDQDIQHLARHACRW